MDDQGQTTERRMNEDVIAALERASTEEEKEAKFKARGMSQEQIAAWLTATRVLAAKLKRPVAPRDFVEYARTEAGAGIRPLLFADTDKEAAEKYRIALAGHFCRMVMVTLGKGPSIRMFQSVQLGGRRGYVETSEAAQTPAFRDQILEDAVRDMRNFRLKYAILLKWFSEPALADLLVSLERAEAALGSGR